MCFSSLPHSHYFTFSSRRRRKKIKKPPRSLSSLSKLPSSMEIYSSDDDLDRLSERFESYTMSADVSESESSTSCFSARQFDHEAGASTSSPPPRPSLGETSLLSAEMNASLPCFGVRNVAVPKAEKKPESEMAGEFCSVTQTFCGFIQVFALACSVNNLNCKLDLFRSLRN